jgi:hypothetical protein
MWAHSVGLGVALILLGLGSYFGTDRVSMTALIPTWFGLAFVVLGILARKEELRKHMMHVAAALGLIGFVVPAIRAIPGFIKIVSGEEVSRAAVISQATMAVLCAVFVGLCVRSFIQARRSRKQAAEQ